MCQGWIAGTGLTSFGKHDNLDTLDLMEVVANEAVDDWGQEKCQIDGLITGYSTAYPHLMLSTLFAEQYGISPSYAHSVQLGGATGCAMIILAQKLVISGACNNVLVVAGEDRLTNTKITKDSAIATLSQIGHAFHEVPYGSTVPGYYGLLASEYLNRHGLTEEDLAQAAVLMRRHAGNMPGAHHSKPITVNDVLVSKKIASPMKLLDCCPISDGAAAILVTSSEGESKGIRIAGTGQAHQHQHITKIANIDDTGASQAASRAFSEASIDRSNIDIIGIYDSFTITLIMLLEEVGFSERGQAAVDMARGHYGKDGDLPLNLHGGLLSYGHSGVAGGMAHLVDVSRRMSEAGTSDRFKTGFIHGDGGVLSSHASVVLERG
jgi:acetyl-CoA acetyltransferase